VLVVDYIFHRTLSALLQASLNALFVPAPLHHVSGLGLLFFLLQQESFPLRKVDAVEEEPGLVITGVALTMADKTRVRTLFFSLLSIATFFSHFSVIVSTAFIHGILRKAQNRSTVIDTVFAQQSPHLPNSAAR